MKHFALALTAVLGFAFAQESFAANLPSIRCELNQEQGDAPWVLLKKDTIELGSEMKGFHYADDEKNFYASVEAMASDDGQQALVQVTLMLHGYSSESQYFTDGKEFNDVSISGPGEPKVTYIVSCHQ